MTREYIPPDPPAPAAFCRCSYCDGEVYDPEREIVVFEGDLFCADCFLEMVIRSGYRHSVEDLQLLAEAFGGRVYKAEACET